MAAQLPGGHGGVRLLPAGVQTAQGEETACWRLQVSVTTSVSLGLAAFPQPPGFHSLHSQVPPGPQLTHRVVSIGSQESVPPPPNLMSPVTGASAGLGEGWAVDSQHSWPLRFPRSPLSGLPPSHTLFLLGCFFLSRTLQGQTKADWQCPLPCPFHLGKLSRGRGRGFREFFVGVAACLLPQPGLELGVPTVYPTLEMQRPHWPSPFPVTGSPVSAADVVPAPAHPALPKAMSQSHWPPRSQSTRPGSP